jgi:large subunit ribosomal protein L14
MLIGGSRVKIIDNSGAFMVKIFDISGKNRFHVGVGDVVRGSVIKSAVGGKVKKGDKVLVLITGVRRKKQRKDRSSIRFSGNFGVIVNSNKDMIGTRIFAPIAREIKDLGYNKVASLAPEVL